MSIKTFTENFWSKLKSLYVTREEYIAGGGNTVVNNSLLEQGWELVSTTTANTPIILPELYTFDELYIEMNYDDGTMVHHTSLRKDSMLYDSTNMTTREIPLDTMQDVQTYVIYNIENNTIVPSYCEGALVDENSTNITTSVYIKKVVEVSIDADMINYDNSVSGINSNDVQGAIDEIKEAVGHTNKNILKLAGYSGQTLYSSVGNTALITKVSDNVYRFLKNTFSTTYTEIGYDFIRETNEQQTSFLTLNKNKEYILTVETEGAITLPADYSFILNVSYNTEEGNVMTKSINITGAGKYSVTISNAIGLNRMYIKTLEGLVVTEDFNIKLMLRDASIEDDTFVPYNEDVKTRVDRLYDIEVINTNISKNTLTTDTSMYVYTAIKRCLVNISVGFYYNHVPPKMLKILKNDDETLAMSSFNGVYDISTALNSSVCVLLEVGETINVYASSLKEGINNMSIKGYVQYLE